MDKYRIQQLQQSFMVVDKTCANVELKREQHDEVKNALSLIADVINEAITPPEDIKK